MESLEITRDFGEEFYIENQNQEADDFEVAFKKFLTKSNKNPLNSIFSDFDRQIGEFDNSILEDYMESFVNYFY